MAKRKNILRIFKGTKECDKNAFLLIKKQILKNPESLLAFAVGKTTDGIHKLIEEDVKKNPSIWEKIKVFQIDENFNCSPNCKKSFNYELRNELKNLFKILPKKNIFLMNGLKNPKETIRLAQKFISPGIDLITLGIGPEYDPHIAYNTTGLSRSNSSLRVVNLHPLIAKKIDCKKGITIGIKEILACREVILLAYGKEKAKSLELAFKKKMNLKKASASALQKHKNVSVIVDKDASVLL